VKNNTNATKKRARADAQKNRQHLLDVAVELILEAGGEPSRDSIAACAGLGIGTLYRHFPDQQSLLHAVACHVLEKTISAGEALLQEDPKPTELLRQYMHMALDNGIGAVNIIHPLIKEPNWADLRARAEAMMKTIVANAIRNSHLRADLNETDIVFALIRFARPLAVGLPLSDERAIAHRHLDIYIDGLSVR
jgi:AcrR family transcriptional regulator